MDKLIIEAEGDNGKTANYSLVIKPNIAKALEMLDFWDELNKKYYDGDYEDDEIQKTSDAMYYGGLYDMLEEVTGMKIEKDKDGRHVFAVQRTQSTEVYDRNENGGSRDAIPLKWLTDLQGYMQIDGGPQGKKLADAISTIINMWQDSPMGEVR